MDRVMQGGGYATMFVQKRRGGKTKATQGGPGILVTLQGDATAMTPTSPSFQSDIGALMYRVAGRVVWPK